MFVKAGIDSFKDIFQSVSRELAFAEFAGKADFNKDSYALRATCVSYMLCKLHGVDMKGINLKGAGSKFAGLNPFGIQEQLQDARNAAYDINGRMLDKFKTVQIKHQDIRER